MKLEAGFRVAIGALLFFTTACAFEEDIEIGTVSLATIRTSNCMSGGSPVRVTANPTAWPNDATASIQLAIDQAEALVPSQAGTICTVQVYIPNGTYRLDEALQIPNRIHLLGQSKINTKLVRQYSAVAANSSAINFSGNNRIHIQNLRIDMRDSLYDTSPPGFGTGHCIRAGNGVSNFEIRNMKLDHCRFYGIGLQCPTDGNGDSACTKRYKNFTIKGIRLNWSGSDGVDMKAMPSAQNANGEFHDLCFTDIGQRDDGNWASALDLSGDNLWVDKFQTINSTKLPLTAGIDLGEGDRRVTNSTFENLAPRENPWVKRSPSSALGRPRRRPVMASS